MRINDMIRMVTRNVRLDDPTFHAAAADVVVGMATGDFAGAAAAGALSSVVAKISLYL